MDQQKVRARAFKVLEIAQRMAEKLDKERGGYWVSNRIEEIRLHFNGYEEPGYSDPECGVVATGNWNSIDEYNRTIQTRDLVSTLPTRIGDIFEKLGIECEWSDEWTECGECGALIRTSPNSYSWVPSYVMGDGDITCASCILENPEDYLRDLEDDPNRAVTLDVDPCDFGYQFTGNEYETGWHPGQNDDPQKIANELRAKGVSRFIFKIDSVGQFDAKWTVYVHDDEWHLVSGAEESEATADL